MLLLSGLSAAAPGSRLRWHPLTHPDTCTETTASRLCPSLKCPWACTTAWVRGRSAKWSKCCLQKEVSSLSRCAFLLCISSLWSASVSSRTHRGAVRHARPRRVGLRDRSVLGAGSSQVHQRDHFIRGRTPRTGTKTNTTGGKCSEMLWSRRCSRFFRLIKGVRTLVGSSSSLYKSSEPRGVREVLLEENSK